jgi:hypothetical protein
VCEDEAGAVIPKMNVNTQAPSYISYTNMSTAVPSHRLSSDPIEGRHCLIHHFIHYYVLKLTQSSLEVALFRRGEIEGCRLDVFIKSFAWSASQIMVTLGFWLQRTIAAVQTVSKNVNEVCTEQEHYSKKDVFHAHLSLIPDESAALSVNAAIVHKAVILRTFENRRGNQCSPNTAFWNKTILVNQDGKLFYLIGFGSQRRVHRREFVLPGKTVVVSISNACFSFFKPRKYSKWLYVLV